MKCWGSEVKNVLSINGFNCVWLQQGVGNDLFFKVNSSKDSDHFVTEWNATIRDKDRYLPYHSDQIIFEPEKYISLLDIYCLTASELDCVNFGLVYFLLTIICIATVSVLQRESVYFV